MAKIEQEIVVTIKTLVQNLNQVQALSNTVKGLGSGNGGSSLASNFIKAGAAAGGTNAIVTKLIDGLEQVGSVGANALGSFVSEGIKFNAVIESSKIGIATLVANTYDIKDANGNLVTGVDAFNAALDKSAELERQLQKSAIETKYEYQDILGFFNSTVIASAGLKTNLEQLVKLTQDFALAAGAANVPVEKVNTGIQQILTGIVTVRNPLARVLFPGEGTKEINDTLKKYKEAGTLVDFLEKKMQVFRLSNDQVSQSFEAVANNATDALKVFEAAATHPLFDKIKETLALIIGKIVDLSGDAVKLQPTFQKLADIIGQILGFLGDRLLGIVQTLFGYLDSIANYLTQHGDEIAQILVDVYAIVEQLALIVVDLFGIVGDTAQANTNLSQWASFLQGIALVIGFIRDVFNIVLGIIEGILGWTLQIYSTLFYGISTALYNLAAQTKGWLDWLLPVANLLFKIADTVGAGGQSFIETGANRLASGLDLNATNQAFDATNRKLPSFNSNAKKSNFSFNSRTGLNHGGDSGANKAKRERDERLRAAKQLFDQIEKYQIASANRALEIATENNKQLLDIEQRRYDDGLTSAEAFYKRKAEIENTDLDNQKATLEKQQKFAKTALGRDLGALSGQFQLSPDEVDATISKLESLNPDDLATADTKTIKQSIEYIKYLEQTADITQKLNLIDLKRKGIQTDTAVATEKQARANKTLLDSLGAEFASSTGDEGLKDLVELHKRISDELPKIVSETNKGLPGVEQFAKSIRDAAEVDTTGIMTFLQDAGIDFNSLSEETRVFIRLMERLEGLGNLRIIQAQIDQAQNAYKFAGEGIKDDFANGRVNLPTALDQTATAKAAAVKSLTQAYEAQKKVLADLEAKGVATPQDRQNVEALRRAIQGLNTDLSELALIQEQIDKDSNLFGAKSDAVDLQRNAGAISAKQAKKATLDLQNEQIAALEQELQALLLLDQSNTSVQEKVAETRNKIAELRNQTHSDFIGFAQNLNGEIGGAFSNFLNTVIEGTESIGSAFRSLLAGLLLGIAKAIAQALLLKYILEPLGLTGGDSGGIGGFLGGLIFPGGGAGKHADGGILSGSGTGRSDSIPIWASHGEGIIPAARVQQYGAGFINSIIKGTFVPRRTGTGLGSSAATAVGEGGGRGTRILNAVHPNMLRDFLTSAEGEEIIVNVIGKNPALVQRLA